MSITLKHIAQQLNVSVSTVSRALQNHPRIGLQTREVVQKLAKELDYQPNATALSLKKQHTKTLGVIVPELTLHFFSEILSGMDDTAFKAGYNLLITQSGENFEREKQQILNLSKANVDGILVATSKQTADYGYFHQLKSKGFPVVFFSRIHPDFPSVQSDDKGGAFLAVEHLIAKDCKNIAHIAGPWHLQNTHHRVEGYINGLKKHGKSLKTEYLVYTDLERESNIEAINKLLQVPAIPDAIFCFNDYVAYDIIQVLKEKNIKTGKDILIVGYGNQPIAMHMQPSLTTVDQQAYQIGQKSVEMMLGILDGDISQKNSLASKLETKLIIRNSTLLL